MSELTREDCLSTFQEAFRGTVCETRARQIASKAITDDRLFLSVLRWLASNSLQNQNAVFVQKRGPNAVARHR